MTDTTEDPRNMMNPKPAADTPETPAAAPLAAAVGHTQPGEQVADNNKPSTVIMKVPVPALAPMEDAYYGLHVVQAGEFPEDRLAPRSENNSELYLTVLGDTFEVVDESQAKNLAYAARRNFGFDQVGIGYSGSVFPISADGKVVATGDKVAATGAPVKVTSYGRTYVLKRSIGTALP